MTAKFWKNSYKATGSGLRIFTILALLFGMLTPLVPAGTAYAASVSGVSFTAGGVVVDGMRYAKSGGSLTLTVATDDTTQCVELTGDHKATQTSDNAKKDWSFSLTANTGEGKQTVAATAYKKFNKNGCIAEQGEKFGTFSASYTLDNNGPSVTGVLVPVANESGWNNTDVTIKWTAKDPVGVPTQPADQTVTANTIKDGVTKTATAKDALGNEGSGSVTVKLDEDAPTINRTRSPEANAAGWNNTDVTVSFTCDDALSGLASCSPATTKLTESKAAQSVTGTAKDVAGNERTATVGNINIDKVAPRLSGAPTTEPNGNGWYKGDVTVKWTAGDALSGLAGDAPANSTIGGEGEGLKATQTVTDKAGNSTTADSPAVKIDGTAPTTGITGASNDWGNGDVTVTLKPGDALSGVASTTYSVDGGAPQTGTSFTLSAEGDHTVTYQSTDRAGNVEAEKTAKVRIDKTAPTIRHTFTPDTYTDGAWINEAVTVKFVCADQGGSGVANCSDPVTKSEEGRGQQVVGTATDNAGNSATDTATVNIDKTRPTIKASADRPANAAGWYNDDVTVSFETDDALSGVATRPASRTLTEGADQSASGTVTDAAGNSASDGVTGINIDKTNPTLTGTPSTTGWAKDDVTVTWDASDALSGLAGAVPAPSTVKGEGNNLSASAEVTDRAGNSKATTVDGIKIDRTAPSTLVSVPEPLATGWYAGDVNVTLTGVDSLSGIATTYYSVDGGVAKEYTAPFTHNLKGEHTITYWSVDVAGNTEDKTAPGHSITLKIDGTPPTTTISLPAAFSTGWYADEVPVAFAATDAESGVAKTYYSVDNGIAQEYDGTFMHTLDGKHTITFWSEDVAGNVEDKTKTANSVEIKVDVSPPTITGSRSPAANTHGWNNETVTVSFKCEDIESGVEVANCTPDTPVGNEGAGQSVSGTAVDNVGKTASTTVENINIDTTKPSLSGAATMVANALGWYNGDVTIKWTGQDGLSGIDPATQPGNSTITGEGRNLGVGPVAIKDKAGNSESASVSGINIDRKAPSIEGAPKTLPNSAGWYTGAVTVGFTCSDSKLADGSEGSGVASCPSDKVLSGNGADQSTTSGNATDKAGNSTSTGKTVGGINIDGMAPQTGADTQCTKVNDYCTGDTATVVLTAVDQAGLSGVKEIHYSVNKGLENVASGATVSVSVPLNGAGEATVSFYAVDKADNRETAGTVSLQYDNIAPKVTHTVTPQANAEGWNNANVKVHFDATDTGSGVDETRTTVDSVVDTETPFAGVEVFGEAYDKAGNKGTDKVTVRLDKTAPQITASAKTADGKEYTQGTWTRQAVTVSFNCSDALSGIAVCPDPVTVTANGAGVDGTGQSVTREVSDKAGNKASATFGGIKIDNENPLITVEGVKDGGIYTLGAAPSASCTAKDDLSGVNADGCKVIVTGGTANGVGAFTYTATATDNAGNTATVTGSYKVTYKWDGFLQPINDTAHQVGTSTSIFKAGSTIPAKFQLKRADGTVVQATTAPAWLTPAKGSATSASVDESVYSDPATSGSTYTWTGTQYQYNWSTKGVTAGYYYRIGVKLDDGQIYYVNIGLR